MTTELEVRGREALSRAMTAELRELLGAVCVDVADLPGPSDMAEAASGVLWWAGVHERAGRRFELFVLDQEVERVVGGDPSESSAAGAPGVADPLVRSPGGFPPTDGDNGPDGETPGAGAPLSSPEAPSAPGVEPPVCAACRLTVAALDAEYGPGTAARHESVYGQERRRLELVEQMLWVLFPSPSRWHSVFQGFLRQGKVTRLGDLSVEQLERALSSAEIAARQFAPLDRPKPAADRSTRRRGS